MANKTLKEEALAYEPKQIKNISELQSVSIDLLSENLTFKDDEQKDFTIKVVEINGEKYRVPISVIRDLKVILEDNPKIQTFKVKRTGQGMQTEYTVIPLS